MISRILDGAMQDMQGKVALITGASSGIGRATAEVFASRGAKVVLAARSEDLLSDVARRIEGLGADATYVVTDVTIAAHVERMIDHAIEKFGRLDYAVNNAGFEGHLASIADVTEEEWDGVLNVNLKAVFLCLKYEARAMLATGNGGAIVNVGSVNSFQGVPCFAPYVTSKHALVGLTTSVSAELGPRGIRVNLLCPGITETPMHRRGRVLFGDAAYDSILASRVHMRRAGQPEEIARTIAFLCSQEAAYITGSTLLADGGFTHTL
jgi:NAD(P)-dependent dehydrogenase (short-subunit alcohol dehydrogenase family)